MGHCYSPDTLHVGHACFPDTLQIGHEGVRLPFCTRFCQIQPCQLCQTAFQKLKSGRRGEWGYIQAVDRDWAIETFELAAYVKTDVADAEVFTGMSSKQLLFARKWTVQLEIIPRAQGEVDRFCSLKPLFPKAEIGVSTTEHVISMYTTR